jgi:hypothetical protein
MGLGWFAAMLALPQVMSYPTPHSVDARGETPCSP